MGRLHWVFFLSILIVTGPALAQVSYPTCNAGWEWVSVSNLPYICVISAPDHGPTLPSRTIVRVKTHATSPRTWRLRAIVAVSRSRPTYDTLPC